MILNPLTYLKFPLTSMNFLFSFRLQLSILFLMSFPIISIAQKAVYIPNYLSDISTVDGQQFSLSKTRQSANFIVIWGDSAGLDPLFAPNVDLRFDPNLILDTMEMIFEAFKNYGFARDTIGTNLNTYKIPIIMLNTFGPSGATGWAYGGDVDGIIGAFWAHPLAMQSGHVAAHELTHSIQAQTVIDYRTGNNLGSVWDNAGIFWETHANFMRNLIYPQDVTAVGMDTYHTETWGDWKNTYENYQLLMAILEEDGIEMVNRLWKESYSNEYPLQTYKRLLNLDQSKFNEKMYKYVRRMATYDFTYNNFGSYFRQYRNDDLQYPNGSAQSLFTILKQVEPNRYQVPIELAPEEYAYSIIPIYPHPDSCAVFIKFKGHTELNTHSGWRYGFVAELPNGTVSRYSPIYAENTAEISFSLTGNESKMYFVIMGAPLDAIQTNATNDTWHGYPKHFRYPYELTIHGGSPEGYQQASNFRPQFKSNGHMHSNGGGWVENTANVSSTVYVSPTAIVRGNSEILGNVRIENTAIVIDSRISGNVQISNNAFVINCNVRDNAMIKGQAYVENDSIWDNAIVTDRAKVSNYKLHGSIKVGGDALVYNESGDCDNGVYYRMTNYYENNLLECDGRTDAHPDNLDVNSPMQSFTSSEMNLYCNCSIFPNCSTLGMDVLEVNDFRIYPNPTSTWITIQPAQKNIVATKLEVYNSLGQFIQKEFKFDMNEHIKIDFSDLPDGIYLVNITSNENQLTPVKVIVNH